MYIYSNYTLFPVSCKFFYFITQVPGTGKFLGRITQLLFFGPGFRFFSSLPVSSSIASRKLMGSDLKDRN